MSVPWGLYVHLPFCAARCPYCAFAVERRAVEPWDDVVARLLGEWRREQPYFTGDPTTVYVGGGTPSRMPTPLLERLLGALPRPASGETTVEANPEDVDDRWVRGAVRAGVTRISLGVQSFQPQVAARLGRARSQRAARRACQSVADAVPRWSIDLIFGVQGQGAAALAADLDIVAELGPPHLSAYGLTIEPGTRFGTARRARPAVDEDTWRARYDQLVAGARAMGLRRYEVSNFARPRHESHHNQGYWQGRPYMGLGAGAHGLRPDGTRTAHAPDVAAWLAGAPHTQEHPTARQRALDMLWPRLRQARGLDVDRFAADTGFRVAARTVDHLRTAGLLRRRGRALVATDNGMALADGLARQLATTLEPSGAADPPR